MSAPFDNPSARLRMSGPERPDFDAIRRTIVGEDQHCECAEQYMTPLITYALHVEAQRDAAQAALDVVLLQSGHFAFCTGGLDDGGCMPTCVELRAALARLEEAGA